MQTVAVSGDMLFRLFPGLTSPVMGVFVFGHLGFSKLCHVQSDCFPFNTQFCPDIVDVHCSFILYITINLTLTILTELRATLKFLPCL